MLSYILGLIQAFERIHGQMTLQVYLNTRHMQQLLDECPGLVNSSESASLGFHIGILSEDALPHPMVSVLPQGTPGKNPHGWPSHHRRQDLIKRRARADHYRRHSAPIVSTAGS